MFAVAVLHRDLATACPQFAQRMDWFVEHRPELARLVSNWREPNAQGFRLLSLMRTHRLNGVLSRMLDETEFLSDHGVRSVSKFHAAHPFTLERDGRIFSVRYDPGEGTTRIYGGNSNWRGPVWMPINYLLVDALREFHKFHGEAYRIACPSGAGNALTLGEVAQEVANRLRRLFLKDASGRRAYLGDSPRQWEDPNFADALQFFEYFQGDDGRGLGASHQTGWTGLIALLLHPLATTNPAPASPADAGGVD